MSDVAHCHLCGAKSPTALQAENDRLRTELAIYETDGAMVREVNRLRAENAEFKEWITTLNAKECDRLRDENAELKDALEESKQYVIWHREAIAEGLMYLREADDLRVKNAELPKALELSIGRLNAMDAHLNCDLVLHLRAILAKTAKEGK